jgi:hypothetical protein
MSDSEKPLREQLTEAMVTIRQHLVRLRSGPITGGPSDDRSVIADLEAELGPENRQNRGEPRV